MWICARHPPMDHNMNHLSKCCLFILFLVLGYTIVTARASKNEPGACTCASKVGDQCVVDVKVLHPTQLAVGMLEVERKAKDIREKTKAKREAYLRKKAVPVVIGPAGTLYLVDHHHLVRALMVDGIDRTYAVVRGNLVSSADFWGAMKAKGWVFLCDENGRGPRDPSTLPTSVADMKDDPYRSLASRVEDEGGIDKDQKNALFLEFAWANFFRPRVQIGSDFEAAVASAKTLAKSPEACGLPGYTGPRKAGCATDPPQCLP